MRELTEKLDALIGRSRWDEAEKLLLDARDRARERRDEALTLSLCSELMGFYRMCGRESGFRSAMEEAMPLLAKAQPRNDPDQRCHRSGGFPARGGGDASLP